MAKTTIKVYSRPKNVTACPPGQDLGGKVKLDDPWNSGEKGTETPATFDAEVGSTHTLLVKAPASNAHCNWQPVDGQYEIGPVPAEGLVFCTEWVCMQSNLLQGPLSGNYAAKRADQATTFDLEITCQQNSEYCLFVQLRAPGAIDNAEAFLHTRTEPGGHGSRSHPGDFMRRDLPLTECFLQGTFVGPRGDQGSLRMALGLIPTADGLQTVVFGGFLTFANAPQQNIETTFTKKQPILWPARFSGVMA